MKSSRLGVVLCSALLIAACSFSAFAKTKKKSSGTADGAGSARTEEQSGDAEDSRQEAAAGAPSEKDGGRAAGTSAITYSDDPLSSMGHSFNIRQRSGDDGSDDGLFAARTVENQVGKIGLLLKGSVGSFQLYSVDTAGNAVPVLAGYDEFTSTFFSVMVGQRQYRLTDQAGVTSGARKTVNGGQIFYDVPNVMQVLADFSCLPSEVGSDADILKITVSVRNTGKRTNPFALKNVLDTVLGEQGGPHFSTAMSPALNHEMQFRNLERVRWIRSGNPDAAIQILLYGADISVPEVVSLANKDMLALPVWEPSVVQANTFDSVLSYNNSAVGINWEGVPIAPETEASFSYYIAFGVGTEEPQGELFLKNFEGKAPDAAARDPVLSAVGPVPKENLNMEYVQNLIDRINRLENDGSVDSAELLRLNRELDMILEMLRRL